VALSILNCGQLCSKKLLLSSSWMDRVWVGFRRLADEFSSIFDMTVVTESEHAESEEISQSLEIDSWSIKRLTGKQVEYARID
jgi:hypothetical protein